MLIKVENNEIQLLPESLAKLKKYRELKLEIDLYEQELKKAVEQAMAENGIKKVQNDLLSITYIEPTTATTLDSKRLKANLPDIWEEYSKVSSKKGYVKIEYHD